MTNFPLSLPGVHGVFASFIGTIRAAGFPAFAITTCAKEVLGIAPHPTRANQEIRRPAMTDSDNTALDPEEQEIEDNFEKLAFLPREEADAIIDRALAKKPLTIRLNESDLAAARKIAEREGLPYQTLISSVLHKYVTGKLVDIDQARFVLSKLK
jgi:predicted DNA binding CopG/RHH family protein